MAVVRLSGQHINRTSCQHISKKRRKRSSIISVCFALSTVHQKCLVGKLLSKSCRCRCKRIRSDRLSGKRDQQKKHHHVNHTVADGSRTISFAETAMQTIRLSQAQRRQMNYLLTVNYPLSTANYQPPTAKQLSTTHYQLPAINQQLTTTNHQPPTTD